MISKDEEEGLRRLMAEGGKGEYKRCLAILLRARGVHPKDVVETLGVTKRSLERWVKAYRAPWCGWVEKQKTSREKTEDR